AGGLRDGALYGVVDLGLAEDVEPERAGGHRTAGGGASGGGGGGQHRAQRTAGAGGDFGQGEVEAAVQSAALGAQELGIALGQKVALQLDVEVILDGQGQSVGEREGRSEE